MGSPACRRRADAATLLALVRDHWRIENQLHYVRDVTLGEDACARAPPRATPWFTCCPGFGPRATPRPSSDSKYTPNKR
ncbi:transposase : [Gemmata massiliana]|uniref:Transposase n=1 Tax=Gemmata massiliana TaxID=1210884 RepID=A0A6P2D0I4_9BACT|nr:transposase : [Gemmata massiliana]